jgi:hypothetical protein
MAATHTARLGGSARAGGPFAPTFGIARLVMTALGDDAEPRAAASGHALHYGRPTPPHKVAASVARDGAALTTSVERGAARATMSVREGQT